MHRRQLGAQHRTFVPTMMLRESGNTARSRQSPNSGSRPLPSTAKLAVSRWTNMRKVLSKLTSHKTHASQQCFAADAALSTKAMMPCDSAYQGAHADIE